MINIDNATLGKDGELNGEAIDCEEAVEKQIAMSPRFNKFTFMEGYFCGRCHHLISVDFEYCPTCGQKIKWEGNEVADL